MADVVHTIRSFRIKTSDIVVVAIGDNTFKSKSVSWETREALKQNKKIIAVKLKKSVKIPEIIKTKGIKVINWKCDTIMKNLRKN